jgi:hypothetical protein
VGEPWWSSVDFPAKEIGPESDRDNLTIGDNDMIDDEIIAINVGYVYADEPGGAVGRIYAHEIRARDRFTIGGNNAKLSGDTYQRNVIENLRWSGPSLQALIRNEDVTGGIITNHIGPQWQTVSTSEMYVTP